MRDPKVLYGNLGPPIRVEVPGQKVTIQAFEETLPLSFDVNIVPIGIMRMVPGISDAEVQAWIRARTAKSFADAGDFKLRAGLKKVALGRLRF